ncbi:hypothetical protein Trydic_g6160 [Trypoxylus dichotomus]
MWIINFFSLISLVLVATHALPVRILDDPIQNAVVSISTNENTTNDRLPGTTEFRHPVVQSKPRILVSYGNMYKQAPTDPMQNLLMYFLMNVARDFAQDQDQFERRRSPNFISDTKSKVTDFTGKVINTSKKVGQKVGDVVKTLTSRDIPVQSQFEETHYYPHIDGTCMCFNRLIRHGSVEMKNDRLKENLINEEPKQSVEVFTDKRCDEITDGQVKTDKTTELKTENHNIALSEKQKSTVAVAENDPMTKHQDNAGVRVLKVMDLDSLDTSKSVSEFTTEQKADFEQKTDDDLVVELKAVPRDISKKSLSPETSKPPLTDTSQLSKREPPNIKKSSKANEDDGYYFLSVSGGTDKRTTASVVKPREHITLYHYENLLPKYEDKLPHLKELKRKRRHFKKHHGRLSSLRSSLDDSSGAKLHIFEDRFHKRAKRHKRHRDNFLLSDDNLIASSPNIGAPDIPVLILPNAFRDDGEGHRYRSVDAEPTTQQTMLLTITLPTFLGGVIFLLGLCYFLRAKGWCCQLFMDKSNIVVVDNINEQRSEASAE